MREIGVFHLGALGDLVVSIPAIRAARRANGPRARVVLFAAGKAKGELLVRGGAAHEAVDLARPDLAPLFAEGGPVPAEIARRARGWAEAVVVLAGGEAVAGNLRRAGAARATTVLPGPVEGGGPPRLRVPAADRAAARRELEALGVPPGRGLAIHPGSGGARKCWPLERFLDAARSARPASRSFFLVGPAELDARPEIAAAIEAAGFPIVREPALPRLAALIQAAGTYLGNDAGPTHLAAAVGARTVALFGPTDAARWAPRGRPGRVATLVAPGGDLGALDVARVRAALMSAP